MSQLAFLKHKFLLDVLKRYTTNVILIAHDSLVPALWLPNFQITVL